MDAGGDADRFTHSAYRELLEDFLQKGYKAVDYEEVNSRNADLILRHDLDFSISRALPLAEIECQVGVRAHYFVLVGSPFYNVFDHRSRHMLRQLVDLGHSVGLHFDAAALVGRQRDLDRTADEESRALEIVTGCPVRVISFHRPAPEYIDWDRSVAGRIQTYHPRFYSEIGYVSDSRGAFRHGEPTQHEAFGLRRAMQLLIHPVWWTEQPISDRVEAVEQILQSITWDVRDAALRNSEPFRLRRTEGQGGDAPAVG